MNTRMELSAEELSRIYAALRYRASEDDPLVRKIEDALAEARKE